MTTRLPRLPVDDHVRNPITGEPKNAVERRLDARRKEYPVSLLARQSMRPITEIVGWIKAGKLKGYLRGKSWFVPQEAMDRWRELVKTEPSQQQQQKESVASADYEPVAMVIPGVTVACICDDDGVSRFDLDPECPLYDSHLQLAEHKPLP